MRTKRLATDTLGSLAFSFALACLSASTGCSKPTDATPATGAAASASPGAVGSASPSPSAPVATTAVPPPSGWTGPFASGFEGAIAMHTTSAHGPTDMVFLTKGGKSLVDVPGRDGQTAHSIFDPTTQKVTIVMDSQQLAMQVPLPHASAAAPNATPPKVTRTGKHETVAGYDCEDWDIVLEGGKREATCVAQGLAFFDFSAMSGPVGGGVHSSWAEELRDGNAFPLRAVESDSAGKETSRMEVTRIEKKSLDDAAFIVPASYHIMQVPALGAEAPRRTRPRRSPSATVRSSLRDSGRLPAACSPASRTVKAKLTALVGLSIVVMLAALPILSWILHRQMLDEVDDRVVDARKSFLTELEDDLADLDPRGEGARPGRGHPARGGGARSGEGAPDGGHVPHDLPVARRAPLRPDGARGAGRVRRAGHAE